MQLLAAWLVTLWVFLYPVIPFHGLLFSFFLWLLCSICFRLSLFFRARKSCVTYLIGWREKCHNRVEIGLWRDWTLGLDETPCHRGNRNLMKSHHTERWCLSLYRTWLQPEDRAPAYQGHHSKETQQQISRKEHQPHAQMYTAVVKTSNYWTDEARHTDTNHPEPLYTQNALITVRGATKSCTS